MLKTVDKDGGKKSKQRQSPSQTDNQSSIMPVSLGDERTNPFRFIESALNEAKTKIERMKNTPQILESLPDVSILVCLLNGICLTRVGREKEEVLEGRKQAPPREPQTDVRQRQRFDRENEPREYEKAEGSGWWKRRRPCWRKSLYGRRR